MTEAALIDAAFEYVFPYVAMGRLRSVTLGDGRKPGPIALNSWNHRRTLAGPKDRRVTTPNSDTTYSILWSDLSFGPVTLIVPDIGDRYYSIAFLEMTTDNFAMTGRRTTSTRADRIILVGPDWQEPLPPDTKVIRAPNNDVMILCRIVVNGNADLTAVNAVQDAFSVEAPAAETMRVWNRETPLGAGPQSYVDMANIMLARNPPPRYERPVLKRFADVGIGGGQSWNALSDDIKSLWDARWHALWSSMTGGLLGIGPVVNGWRYSKSNLGKFGTDYTYRAEVALDGLLALEPAEATYPSTRVDRSGETLHGANRYRLHLPAGVPDVNAFWSLSMYQKEDSGMLFFTNNAIARFAIGDRTEGLARDANGAVTIAIQHEEPTSADARANWLPAPREAFHLVMRAYEPKPSFRDVRRPLPPVERL